MGNEKKGDTASTSLGVNIYRLALKKCKCACILFTHIGIPHCLELFAETTKTGTANVIEQRSYVLQARVHRRSVDMLDVFATSSVIHARPV